MSERAGPSRPLPRPRTSQAPLIGYDYGPAEPLRAVDVPPPMPPKPRQGLGGVGGPRTATPPPTSPARSVYARAEEIMRRGSPTRTGRTSLSSGCARPLPAAPAPRPPTATDGAAYPGPAGGPSANTPWTAPSAYDGASSSLGAPLWPRAPSPTHIAKRSKPLPRVGSRPLPTPQESIAPFTRGRPLPQPHGMAWSSSAASAGSSSSAAAPRDTAPSVPALAGPDAWDVVRGLPDPMPMEGLGSNGTPISVSVAPTLGERYEPQVLSERGPSPAPEVNAERSAPAAETDAERSAMVLAVPGGAGATGLGIEAGTSVGPSAVGGAPPTVLRGPAGGTPADVAQGAPSDVGAERRASAPGAASTGLPAAPADAPVVPRILIEGEELTDDMISGGDVSPMAAADPVMVRLQDDAAPAAPQQASHSTADERDAWGGARVLAGITSACHGCGRWIGGTMVHALGHAWHARCFRCEHCGTLLEHVSFYEHDGRPYCHLDYHELFGRRCYHCQTPIVDERCLLVDALGGVRTYHELHFFCASCGEPFVNPTDAAADASDVRPFFVHGRHAYCEACHERRVHPPCQKCGRPVGDEYVAALRGKWHPECLTCTRCGEPCRGAMFLAPDGSPCDLDCYQAWARGAAAPAPAAPAAPRFLA